MYHSIEFEICHEGNVDFSFFNTTNNYVPQFDAICRFQNSPDCLICFFNYISRKNGDNNAGKESL
jgi:hypothetical protein